MAHFDLDGWPWHCLGARGCVFELRVTYDNEHVVRLRVYQKSNLSTIFDPVSLNQFLLSPVFLTNRVILEGHALPVSSCLREPKGRLTSTPGPRSNMAVSPWLLGLTYADMGAEEAGKQETPAGREGESSHQTLCPRLSCWGSVSGRPGGRGPSARGCNEILPVRRGPCGEPYLHP